MNSPKVYLAGKMAGLSYEEMTKWRELATRILKANKINALNPVSVPLSDEPSTQEIVTSNKFQIGQADVLLVELDYEEPSLGTIGEIVYAYTLGKPIIAWGRAYNIIQNPWILAHLTIHFTRLDDAVIYIIHNYGPRSCGIA